MDTIKSIDQLMNEPPSINGEFNNADDVAMYIYRSRHSILLDGILIYAYKGDGSIKSLVMSIRNKHSIMVSIFYDSYNMIFTGLKYNNINEFINNLGYGKGDLILNKSLINKFYDI